MVLAFKQIFRPTLLFTSEMFTQIVRIISWDRLTQERIKERTTHSKSKREHSCRIHIHIHLRSKKLHHEWKTAVWISMSNMHANSTIWHTEPTPWMNEREWMSWCLCLRCACVWLWVFKHSNMWRICRAHCIYSVRRSPGACFIQFVKIYTRQRESERTQHWTDSEPCCWLFSVLCVHDNEFIIFKVQCTFVRDSPQTGCTQFSFSVFIQSPKPNPISFSFCVPTNSKWNKSFFKWKHRISVFVLINKNNNVSESLAKQK